MIIVEGADNAGKSTLVRELIEMDPRLRLVHRERFKPHMSETIGTSYLKALLPADGDRLAHGYSVADRLVASEIIYGDLFRGGSRLTSAEKLAIRLVLDSYGAMVIHCDTSDEVITKSWKEREQMYEQDPLVIARAYRERMNEIFPDQLIIKYDWTNPTNEGWRNKIVRQHAGLQDRMATNLSWWSAFPYGAGSLVPDVIMVGEELSPNAKNEVPFATGPAGDFLCWAIGESRIRVGRLYITNAIKGTDRDAVMLREEMDHLISSGRTRVILLGREAEKMYDYVLTSMRRVPRSVSRIPHPQYWRRFHWARKDEYVTQLNSCLED